MSFSLHPGGHRRPVCLMTGDVSDLEPLVQVVPAGFVQFTESISVFLYFVC